MRKQNLLLIGTALFAAVLFFVSCGGGAGGGGSNPQSVSYSGTNGGVTFKLQITENPDRAAAYTPVAGDAYKLTASGKESSGEVKGFTGTVFTLKHSDSGTTFTVTINGSGVITNISGTTIAWNDNTTTDNPWNQGSGGGGWPPSTHIEYEHTWIPDDMWAFYGLRGLNQPAGTRVQDADVWHSGILEVVIEDGTDTSTLFVEKAAYEELLDQINTLLSGKMDVTNVCSAGDLESKMIQYTYSGIKFILNLVYRDRPLLDGGWGALFLSIQPKPDEEDLPAWPTTKLNGFGFNDLQSALPSYIILTSCSSNDTRIELKWIGVDESIQELMDDYLVNTKGFTLSSSEAGVGCDRVYRYSNSVTGFDITTSITGDNRFYFIYIVDNN